jgi:hypothetical protein
MSDQVYLFGRFVDIPSIGKETWRVRKRLLAAKLLNAIAGRGFSGAENLLYILCKHDHYLHAVSLIPLQLSAKLLRQMQRKQDKKQLNRLTVNEIAIYARSEADGLSHKIMSIEHLLLALVRFDPRSAALLNQCGVNYENARHIVLTRGVSGYAIKLFGFSPTFYRSRVK